MHMRVRVILRCEDSKSIICKNRPKNMYESLANAFAKLCGNRVWTTQGEETQHVVCKRKNCKECLVNLLLRNNPRIFAQQREVRAKYTRDNRISLPLEILSLKWHHISIRYYQREERRADFNDAFSWYCRRLVSSCCVRSLFTIYVPATQYGVVTSTVTSQRARARAVKSTNRRAITNG